MFENWPNDLIYNTTDALSEIELEARESSFKANELRKKQENYNLEKIIATDSSKDIIEWE